MVEITSIENEAITEFEVKGKLTKDDIKQVDNFFDTKVNKEKPINILLKMKDWEGFTLKGLLEDFKMINQIKKMNKVAVVADSNFLKKDAKIEDLYPGVSIVYFETDEIDAAKEWLKE